MSDKDKKVIEDVKKWLDNHYVSGGTKSVSIQLKENTGKVHSQIFIRK